MGIISKLFGKKEFHVSEKALDIVEECLNGIFNHGGLDLSYEIEENDQGQVLIELFGTDEEALKLRDGQLLEAFQFFIKRALQHKLPDEKVEVIFDSNNFRQESDQSLIDLAEKLKGIVLEKGRPAYVRALPPRERRIIHQHLAEDKRVKTRSIGEGHYKKIKIFPIGANNGSGQRRHNNRNKGPYDNQNRPERVDQPEDSNQTNESDS
jgi:spoIIIJ-associated protein